METLILLIQEHSAQNFLDEHFKDLVRLGCFFIWLAILFFPLSGIDRNDDFASFSYGIYLLACGVVLIYAIPSDRETFYKHPSEYLIFLALTLLITIRWNFKIQKLEMAKKTKIDE